MFKIKVATEMVILHDNGEKWEDQLAEREAAAVTSEKDAGKAEKSTTVIGTAGKDAIVKSTEIVGDKSDEEINVALVENPTISECDLCERTLITWGVWKYIKESNMGKMSLQFPN